MNASRRFHVGNDVQRFGQFALRHLVFDRCGENQLEYLPDICVGTLVETAAVTNLLENVAAFDPDETGMRGERDEVISERSGVALGKIDAERKCDSSGQGTGIPVHGGYSDA